MKVEKILDQIRHGKSFIMNLDRRTYDHYRKGVKIGVISCRITNQSGGVYAKDGGTDVSTLNTTPYVLADYNADLQENDRLVLGKKTWTVGAPSRPTPAGTGPSCVQAPLVFNGEV